MKNRSKIRYLKNSLLIDNKVLVLGDLHIGYEEMLQAKGLVGTQFKSLIEDLKQIFEYLLFEGIIVRKVVLLGDVKHEFGNILDSEWKEVLKLLDFLKEIVGEKNIIIVKGNHDKILEPIIKKRNIKLRDYYKYKGFCFAHGDNEVFLKKIRDIRFLIFGHLHPAVTLDDGYKRERFKCFLKGKWKRKEVVVIPAFSSFSLGFDINERYNYYEKNKDDFFIIPDSKLKEFEVLIYNEKKVKFIILEGGKEFDFKDVN